MSHDNDNMAHLSRLHSYYTHSDYIEQVEVVLDYGQYMLLLCELCYFNFNVFIDQNKRV